MKQFFRRFLAVFSLLSGLLLLFRPPVGWLSFVLWPFKIVVGSLTPVSAVLGGLSALWGLLTGDAGAVAAGGVGTAVATNYIRQLTTPSDPLAQLAGPDWRKRISPEARARFLPRRWTPLWLETGPARWLRSVSLGPSALPDRPLLADIWRPLGSQPTSGVGLVFLHGGAWRYGKKDMLSRPMFRHLAAQGHVIVDVAYSLAPEADVPQMVSDVNRAILWLKTHAENLGVDPQRIVLMGGSAGAHLALLAAYAPNEPAFQPQERGGDTRVRAVVSYYGPPDFRALHETVQERFRRGADTRPVRFAMNEADWVWKWLSGIKPTADFGEPLLWLANMVGGLPEEVPEAYPLTSPVSHVGRHCPPTLLIQPEDDFGGLDGPVRALESALRAVGVPVALIELPHTEHAFDLVLPQISPAAQSVLYDVERFLALQAARD